MFNPGMVVFGGMLRDLYPGAAAQVGARIATSVLPVARERVQLRTSALGDDATLLGAADLGFSRLLDDPLEVLEHGRPVEPVTPAVGNGSRR